MKVDEKRNRNRLAAEKYRRKKEIIINELQETISRLNKEKLEIQQTLSRIQHLNNDLLNEKAYWIEHRNFCHACCMMKCQNTRNSNFQENQELVNSPNHENNPPDLSALVKDEDFVEFTTPTIDKTCQDLLKDWGSNSILMPIIENI